MAVAVTAVADRLYGVHCHVPVAMTIDKVSFYLTNIGNTGARARMAVYQQKAANTLWPGALLMGSAEFDVTSTTSNQPRNVASAIQGKMPISLLAGQHIFLVVWCNTAASIQPKLRFDTVVNHVGRPALDGTFNAYIGPILTYSATTLPDPFPSDTMAWLPDTTAPLFTFRRSS